jgi:hypothetical protein
VLELPDFLISQAEAAQDSPNAQFHMQQQNAHQLKLFDGTWMERAAIWWRCLSEYAPHESGLARDRLAPLWPNYS